MELYRNLCKNCGGDLLQTGDELYKCHYCGSVYVQEDIEKHKDSLKKLLNEMKLEALSNARKNLYDAVNAEYISDAYVHECCFALKQLLPDDVQANFYDTVLDNNSKKISKVIRKIDVKENADCVETMIRFLIKSLQSEYILETCDLIERAYKNVDLLKFEKYSTQLSAEAEKIDNCVYMTSFPRDVFVAYSSKDMDKVFELVECLEDQGFSCFVAARNLRHGKGAVENYEAALHDAMDNCQSFVFVSSMNSRHPGCDALRKEIPYIKSKDIMNAPADIRNDYSSIPHKYKKHRIEYRLEESDRQTAADRMVSEFFDGYERVYSEEEVAQRVLDRSMGADASLPVTNVVEMPRKEEKYKYCVKCKSECSENAKFCINCGGNSFANSLSEVDLRRELEELKASREARINTAPSANTSSQTVSPSASMSKPSSSPAKKITYPQNAKESVGLAFRYNESQDGYELVGLGNCTDEHLVIPRMYNGKRVLEAANSVFYGNTYIKSVTLPNTFRYIAPAFFSTFRGLESVYIPSSVTYIGNSAFHGCSSLKHINLESNITSIERLAFALCSSLEEIVIPDSLSSITRDTFYSCKSLKKVTFGKGVTSIGEGAFTDCESLESIVIPDKIKSLGSGVFSGCKALKEVVLGTGLKSIGASAFYKCTALEEITIPDGVTGNIGKFFFSHCTSLKKVTIGNGINGIADMAFYQCGELEEIDIRRSLLKIEADAFSSCEKLRKITVDPDNQKYKAVDGNLYSKDGKILVMYAPAKPETNFTIPDGVQYISGVSHCNNLKTVTIPDSAIEIASESFFCSSNIEKMYFKNPNGWKVKGLIFGTNISSGSLSDPEKAVGVVKSYYNKTLIRK